MKTYGENTGLPPHIIRAALYIRVSTEEQAMHGYSLQAQEDCLLQYAREHGYKVVGIYRDEGNSARKAITKRKVVLQLLEDVQADKIDLILFIKLDRWTRNVEAYHSVQRILDAHNVSWQAALEDYETLTANGRFKVNIMLSVNESESDRTSERIKFVNQAKRQRKEWCFPGGPSHWPDGYMPQVIDGVKRCVKNPERQDIIQDFWDYATKYSSIRKAGMYCCEKHGITKHYRSWMNTARNELYTGTFRGIEGYCEPYVSRADWERLVINREVIKKTQRPERVYLFTGLIRCPECGNTLKATFKTYPSDRSKEYNGYRCNNGRLRACAYRHQVSERTVEKYLLANIRQDLDAYILQVEAENVKKQQKPKLHDIVALQEQLRRLNVIYMAGNITDQEYTSENARLKAEIEKARIESDTEKPVNLEHLKNFLSQNFLSLYKTLSQEDKRRLWRSLISEIHVEGCKVTGITPRIY